MSIIVQTPRLVVRKFKRSEERLLLSLYSDKRVTEHVPKRTVEETKRQFADALKSYKLFPGLGRWGVFNVIDNDFIGVCILKPADSDPSRIELGYVLAPKYWGAGLATELARALVIYGFEKRGLSEICACTSPKNVASQNVLIKAGLRRDGTIFWHNADLSFFRIEKN
jgi:[ribosomal protein S5]-alanine N-acetyltransferase